MDAYIIYLNADESIDATRKGSLARFINHSWYVLRQTLKIFIPVSFVHVLMIDCFSNVHCHLSGKI